jgi:Rrf2 family protein
MIDLAVHEGGGPVSVDTIAEQQGISAAYIHVLLAGLKSAGLVRTVRGPSGGLILARRPAEISALDIVTALEGRISPVDCVNDSTTCSRSSQCASRSVWCEVAGAIHDALEGFSLDRLAASQVAMQNEPLMYNI